MVGSFECVCFQMFFPFFEFYDATKYGNSTTAAPACTCVVYTHGGYAIYIGLELRIIFFAFYFFLKNFLLQSQAEQCIIMVTGDRCI